MAYMCININNTFDSFSGSHCLLNSIHRGLTTENNKNACVLSIIISTAQKKQPTTTTAFKERVADSR